jgi:hypothetical protein
MFDENRTIGELSRMSLYSPVQMATRLQVIRTRVLNEALSRAECDTRQAEAMADAFVGRVVQKLPPAGTSVRQFLVSTLVERGLDAEEVHDDSVLADLSALATFRSQLRLVASKTGRSFGQLKSVPMEALPSRLIGGALKKYGQPRRKRPGSDLIDGYLGVLAAYSDVLYVDKRTAEDFKRAIAKEPRLTGLIGSIAKGAEFTDIESADLARGPGP